VNKQSTTWRQGQVWFRRSSYENLRMSGSARFAGSRRWAGGLETRPYAVPFGLLLALAFTFLLALLPSPAHAQSTPTVTDLGVEAEFPDRLAFNASAESDSPITRLRLRYEILPDGTLASGDAEIEAGTSVTASFALQAADQTTLYLPPGTTIVYHWEATDEAGETGESPEATFFYDDNRFEWTPLEQGGVTIRYYSGKEDAARQMLEVGAEIIAEMSALLGTTVDFPVKVWIYDSVSDMRPALPRRSETYESSVITAGIRITTDTVLVLGEASYDTLRHELTHVVTASAGEGGLGSIPAWLDEGTAVYSQRDAGGFEVEVERAIGRGNVLSVRSITSSPGDPAKVGLFYGQSWSLVSYLVETYGGEQFAQLYAEIKTGKRIDSALKAVYGFDQDGLEDEWRDFHDLPPRVTPEPSAAPLDEPTAEPGGNPPASSDDGGSGGTAIIVLIGALALAGVIGFAGFTLARRFR